MRTSNEQLFLQDLLPALLTHIAKAQENAIASRGTDKNAFDFGVLHGYWQVMISIMARLDIHEVDRHAYGLGEYDADSIWLPFQQAVRDAGVSPKVVKPSE